MRSIIFCEGVTDQILLSYWFRQTLGFAYQSDSSIDESADKFGNAIDYSSQGDILTIWAIGGKDNFPRAFDTVLKRNRIDDDLQFFSRIAFIFDHDSDEENHELVDRINRILDDNEITLDGSDDETVRQGLMPDNRVWVAGNQMTAFQKTREIRFLLRTVPSDETGAIETFFHNLMSAAMEEMG